MSIETIIAIKLVAFVVSAIVVLFVDNGRGQNPGGDIPQVPVKVSGTICCGAHKICGPDKIKVNVGLIENFEDEELVRFQGVAGNSYTDRRPGRHVSRSALYFNDKRNTKLAA